MKCEIEFEGYQYLTLNDFSQIEHHVNKAAFDKFLRLAPAPKALRVIVGGKEQETAGSVHVWGVVTAEGRASAMNRYHLADVLSVEDMLVDLAEWQPARWAD